jgi:hypothetical protein
MDSLPFAEGECARDCSFHDHFDRVIFPASFKIITNQHPQALTNAHAIIFTPNSQIRKSSGFHGCPHLHCSKNHSTDEIVKSSLQWMPFVFVVYSIWVSGFTHLSNPANGPLNILWVLPSKRSSEKVSELCFLLTTSTQSNSWFYTTLQHTFPTGKKTNLIQM